MTSGNFSICGLTLQPGNLGNTQTGARVTRSITQQPFQQHLSRLSSSWILNNLISSYYQPHNYPLICP